MSAAGEKPWKISPKTSLSKSRPYPKAQADLLRKLVDVLYEQAERQEEYDEEPFSAEDLAAIQEGEEADKRGAFTSLEDYEKERSR
jgi:hypothetical protein